MEGFPTREEMIAIYEEEAGREVRSPHYWEVFGAMHFDAIMIVLRKRASASVTSLTTAMLTHDSGRSGIREFQAPSGGEP